MEDYKPYATPSQSGEKLTKECNSTKVDATLYQQLIGSLVYLTHSRPAISSIVSVISRFMQDSQESHFEATKRIVCCIKGTY